MTGLLMESGPREITCCLIRRLESRDTPRRAFEVKLWGGVFRSRRGNAVNASSHFIELAVSHVMTTDSCVVPIGDKHGTNGRDANIGRTKPIIGAGEKIGDGGTVTRAVIFHWISADHFGTRIAVN